MFRAIATCGCTRYERCCHHVRQDNHYAQAWWTADRVQRIALFDATNTEREAVLADLVATENAWHVRHEPVAVSGISTGVAQALPANVHILRPRSSARPKAATGCSMSCRRSRAPRSACRCACGGRSHGTAA